MGAIKNAGFRRRRGNDGMCGDPSTSPSTQQTNPSFHRPEIRFQANRIRCTAPNRAIVCPARRSASVVDGSPAARRSSRQPGSSASNPSRFHSPVGSSLNGSIRLATMALQSVDPVAAVCASPAHPAPSASVHGRQRGQATPIRCSGIQGHRSPPSPQGTRMALPAFGPMASASRDGEALPHKLR